MIITSNDLVTLYETRRWIRKIVVDGLHDGFIDGIGQDRVMKIEKDLNELIGRIENEA